MMPWRPVVGSLLFAWSVTGVGCGNRFHPVTKIDVLCPGLSTVECDKIISLPLVQAVVTIPKVEDVTAYSRVGRVEVFVTWEASENRGAVAGNLDFVKNLLPPNAGPPTLSSLADKSSIPRPEPGEQEVVTVVFDQDKLAALGVSAKAAEGTVRNLLDLAAGDVSASIEKLNSATIQADGREIPLRDIAKVGTELHPICMVR